MKTVRMLGLATTAGVLILLLAVAPSFACAPTPTVSTVPQVGQPGSEVELRGSGYGSSPDLGPVEIYWDYPNGPRLATVAGPSFSLSFTLPANAQPRTAAYEVVGLQYRLSDGTLRHAASTSFYVSPRTGGAGDGTPARGYRPVASDGGVFAFGEAGYFGSMGGWRLNRPIVGMASTPTGRGYWEVASDGGIFAFGDAGYFGSMGGRSLVSPIVGMAATPSGQGYWMVAADGGVFAFGDAGFFGSVGGHPRPAPVVGMATFASGSGYLLAGADGGTYAYSGGGVVPVSTAAVRDSSARLALARPVVGIAAGPPGFGHWLVAADGGVFASGGAGFFGSTGGLPLSRPVVGMAGTGRDGYWLVASDGGVFAFGDAPFRGSTGGMPLVAPVVGIAAG